MAGIYIHIPFCKQACHYCDFHFSTSLKYKREVLKAMHKELQLRAEELKGEIVETIYFGGGTPSLLSISEIESFLACISKNFKVSKHPEITLEANPDDLNEEKIKALSLTRVNRLSIGIQSFFEEDLKMMNRAHSAQESEKCLAIATKYFDLITIDLIYGVPGLTNERWKQNLQKAFDYKIAHISSYALTVEEKTALASFIKNKTYPSLDENLALEHFNTLVSETEKNGFEQYEISNFAKKGAYSKHNTAYWQGVAYLGVGPSAHSFIKNRRAWNIANNAKYLRALQQNTLALEIEDLSLTDRYNEYIMTGLRTVFGVSLENVKNRFGEKYFEYLQEGVAVFLREETVVVEEGILKTTQKGKFLADGIAAELFYV
ncbi:radical SAM family heme chaperone HemW [Flavicella sediminum]|uniref:radical SAM family heme chaperone HemW n=1 Tax=Flavicella sediminum TaxID=2585141 RepID=UPI00111F8719|nr:radical SAM family heme chaperone HemW [Flavicella sediminum]